MHNGELIWFFSSFFLVVLFGLSGEFSSFDSRGASVILPRIYSLLDNFRGHFHNLVRCRKFLIRYNTLYSSDMDLSNFTAKALEKVEKVSHFCLVVCPLCLDPGLWVCSGLARRIRTSFVPVLISSQ